MAFLRSESIEAVAETESLTVGAAEARVTAFFQSLVTAESGRPTVTMSNTSPALTKKSLGLAGLAAFGACAACCAVPLFVAAGVGGGALTAIAGYIRPGMDLLLGGVAGVAVLGVMAYRARARKAAACATTCEVAGGCGCSPSAKESLLSTPSPAPGEPVVCTADLRDKPTVQGQLDGYRAAFQHLLRIEEFENGVRWVFANRPGLDTELRNLAEKEHQCCSFFKFDLRVEGDTIRWETRATKAAAAVLAEYARLPDQLALHPKGREAPVIKRAIGGAGLIFAADSATPK